MVYVSRATIDLNVKLRLCVIDTVGATHQQCMSSFISTLSHICNIHTHMVYRERGEEERDMYVWLMDLKVTWLSKSHMSSFQNTFIIAQVYFNIHRLFSKKNYLYMSLTDKQTACIHYIPHSLCNCLHPLLFL